MANAVHAKNSAIWANQFDISNYLNQYDAQGAARELDQTTFQDPARTYVPGYKDGSLNLEGFFSHDDTDLDTANDVFESAFGSETARVITVAPEGGATFGNRCLLHSGVEVKHDINAAVGNLVLAMASFRGGVHHGVLLAHKTARTATGNGTGVDNTTSSANGGVGHIHVFSRSGTSPTLDVKIQHSTDNVTFADLITFTQATNVTSQRLSVTGTVNRYTRETRTIGGSSTPTFTYAVAFARY